MPTPRTVLTHIDRPAQTLERIDDLDEALAAFDRGEASTEDATTVLGNYTLARDLLAERRAAKSGESRWKGFLITAFIGAMLVGLTYLKFGQESEALVLVAAAVVAVVLVVVLVGTLRKRPGAEATVVVEMTLSGRDRTRRVVETVPAACEALDIDVKVLGAVALV